MKQKIYDYHLLNVAEIEKYSEKVSNEIEEIASKRMGINKLTKKSAVDIITEYNETRSDAEAVLKTINRDVHVKQKVLSLPNAGEQSLCCISHIEMIVFETILFHNFFIKCNTTDSNEIHFSRRPNHFCIIYVRKY